MARLYVLVKRTGAKRWQVAIPAKAGVTMTRLRSVIAKSRKKGYSYKIASEAMLRKLVKLKSKRKPVKRKATRRRPMRRKRKR